MRVGCTAMKEAEDDVCKAPVILVEGKAEELACAAIWLKDFERSVRGLEHS